MIDDRISLFHHGNASNVRQSVLAFAETDLLHQVITTLVYNSHAKVWDFLNLLPSQINHSIREELSKRTWDIPQEYIQKYITVYPWYEILRLFLLRTKLHKSLGITTEQIGNLGFLLLDRYVAKYHLQNISAIYSYEDIAATTFEKAKKQNILCLYDLPIPFYQTIRKIMQEEAELFPCLKDSISSIHEPDWKLQRKQKEIELADHILVASSVTQKSLITTGIKSDRISVIPYGAPVESFQPQVKSDDCFRVIFAGKISPLKGVHYLLAAWQEIQSKNSFKNTQLVLVGQNQFPKGWLEEHYKDLYTHIFSVSHFSLNRYYSQSSVLVLPSLIDGFGLVVLEAMACGIPVIMTINTGASDVINDGVEGFIIPIRDVAALKAKLEWCYSYPQELAEMGKAARRRAEQLTWANYRQKLAMVVKQKLELS